MKKTNIIIAVIAVLAIIGIAMFFHRPTTDSVMRDFHAGKGRAEDMLMDPLILNTSLVKSRVLQDIKNPEMDKRRYAIAFLGNEKLSEAIPVLEKILNDESEKDYFRGDALESIFRIDEFKGRNLAIQYSTRKDYLGWISKKLQDSSYKPIVRTRRDALKGHHD